MPTALAPAATLAAQANAYLLNKALKRLAQTGQDDPELRQSMPLPEVVEALQREDLAAIEVFARACEAYGDRPMLGERARVLESTPAGVVVRALPEFRTLSYREAWRRTVALATGLARDPRTAVRPGELVGIFGFGSMAYVLADLACLYAGAVSAVLQTSMAPEDLAAIINEGAFATVIAARDSLPALLGVLADCPSVRSVVVMDGHEQALPAPTALPLITLPDLEALGRAASPLAPFLPDPGTDPLATLMYTSGSTGLPKGAMFTQRLWRTHWQLANLTQFVRFPAISLCFYPLSHVMGRNAVLRSIVLGGVMHFTLKSDMSTLFEDIRLSRPTSLNLVPRLSELIHQAYRAELAPHLRAGTPLPAAQAQVFAAMRSTFLGDRLVAAVIGSAPTAPEVVAFLGTCFEIPVYEGYGSTEAGVLSVDGEIARPFVLDYKLVDVPELGYHLSDRPYPRGELRVKTRQCIQGYFRNEAATLELYDEDRFLKTGDIVEEQGPDQVLWCDRKNNVVKLAQGEFVTLWRLESTFSGLSPLLDQVYLYANSQRAYLLAVVVPDWTALHQRLAAQGAEPAPSAVRGVLLEAFNRVAGLARLRAYEVPRDLLVETERWTRDNGLLTGINKPARPQLRLKYGERLEALYAQLETQRLQDLDLQDQGDPGAPLEERIQRAVAAVLGQPGLTLGASSFNDLGGDSISAVTLAASLEELCGVPVSAAAILNPGRPLRELLAQLRRPAPAGGPRFEAIHGRGATEIRAQDLRLENFLSPAELAEAAAVAAQPLPAEVRTVLITGANGFLGRMLCLAWLEHMAKVGGTVCCLVRAEDDAAAWARLHGVYRTGDAELEQRYATLADQHLAVVAGDFAVPGLGLATAAYLQLAAEVDLIVHAGALVNHVFSYEQLFTPNVVGTTALLRLALHGRRKRLDYVSTLAVLMGAGAPERVLERDGVGALAPVWPVSGGYAQGYATSKWASEVLLREAHERFDLPGRVFRADMLLPHRRYLGQANGPDMLSRLLASVIATGLAPRSFYEAGPGAGQGAGPGAGQGAAHYDGLPVEFVAAAMVALSSAFEDGYRTYQVSNANRSDGVSLDTLMDWVVTAGYPLERLSPYEHWFEAFSARLQALPARQGQHSALALLQQWAHPSPGGPGVDARDFVAGVARCQPEGEAGLPHLTEAYLHKYLADLRALGILEHQPSI